MRWIRTTFYCGAVNSSSRAEQGACYLKMHTAAFSAATQRPGVASTRASCRRSALQIHASGLAEGVRVRVKQPITVYHVPKLPNLSLLGVEGTVAQVVKEHKGKPVSANLPYKVAFLVEKEGQSVKFFAHMVRSPAADAVQ